MLGLWAADIMGKNENDADAYAQELIMASFESPKEEHIINKVVEDLRAEGKDISNHNVVKELQSLHAKAHDMIFKDEKL